jgi:hypothetical protein
VPNVPGCVLKKFDGKNWSVVDSGTGGLSPIGRTIQSKDGKTSRFQVGKIWYSTQVECLRGESPEASRSSADELASVKRSDWILGMGYVMQSRTVDSPFGSTYGITAKVLELDLGYERSFLSTDHFDLKWGALLAPGLASVDQDDSTAILYTIKNQITFSGRFFLGAFYRFSPKVSFGLLPGAMYSIMSLPAPPDGSLNAPKSGLFSIYWQGSFRYRMTPKMGLGIDLGLNQISKKLMAGASLLFPI